MHKFLSLIFIFISFSASVIAQEEGKNTDTFFLAKKKGLLGKLGRSITRSSQSASTPVRSVDQYKIYNGKIIRFIEIVPVGFNQNLNDTSEIRKNLAISIANRFHKRSRDITIRKNLFFKEGDIFLPLLVADNERFLRSLPYLKDASIVVYKSVMSNDSVDVIVLTRDVFSIGGNLDVSGVNRILYNVREENLLGTGTRFAVTGIFDKNRTPGAGIGVEITERNIRGSFLSGTLGFKSFEKAILSDRYEENAYYLELEKPLVSRYTEWTGALSISHHETINGYLGTAQYLYTSRYRYNNFDFWGGYNIGWGKNKKTDSEKRLRHFVAGRTFYNYFKEIPLIFKDSFNYNFTNTNGFLFSYSLYKQNFYKTRFIYGFGRNEDVPAGINASVVAGWTNTQNRLRGYYGVEFDASSYSRRDFFSDYTARVGGYRGANSWEDINLLLSVRHFTKLLKISKQWLNRNFVSVSYSRLFNQQLSEPIKLQSEFGLPFFRSDSINTLEFSSRATFKLETVFFNLHKVLGFRFAPFAFGELSILKPVIYVEDRSEFYSAIGGGVRTRNENLVMGTVELRCYYFPRISTAEMTRWKIVLTSNVKLNFNTLLGKRPDLITVN